MAAKKTKTKLADKLGNKGRKAHEAHKGDDTKLGNVELPEGIENGIAQLTDCRFGEYEKGAMQGEPFFIASGIIVEPKKHEGAPVFGLRTSIMEPICDTPKRTRQDVEAHLEWVYNELRKLGLNTDEIDFDSLEEAVEALKEAAPYFRFRTWKGDATKAFPNPRVNHQWSGAVEYQEDGDTDDGVTDNTDEVAKEDETEDDEVETSSTDTDDLDTLADLADNDDSSAQKTLEAKAKELGLSKEADTADNWGDVVTLIREAEAVDNEEPDDSEESTEAMGLTELGEKADDDDDDAIASLNKRAEDAGLDPDEYEKWSDLAKALGDTDGGESEWKPEKGEIYKVKPPKKKKAVECEVTAVFEGKETANIKDLDSGTSYKGVSWDRFVQSE